VGRVRCFALATKSGAEIAQAARQTGDFQVWIWPSVRRFRREHCGAVRAALKRFDSNLPAARIRTMRRLTMHSVFPRASCGAVAGRVCGFGLIHLKRRCECNKSEESSTISRDVLTRCLACNLSNPQPSTPPAIMKVTL
jgi:hypothetical protein